MGYIERQGTGRLGTTGSRGLLGHVTIALSVFNGAAFVERAVTSIGRQSYRNFDLYVVDDCSADKTVEKLLPLIRSDSRFHLVKLSKNIGTYAAKNLILKKYCNGDYFAHQDADDYSWPERLEKQVAFLDSHQEVPACGTGIDEFFESMEDAPRIPGDEKIVFNESDRCFHRNNHYPVRLPKGNYARQSLEDLSRIKIAMNGSIVFRAAVLKGLGGYDGTARVAGDTELLWRILACYDFVNLPQVLYSRRFHAASLTRSDTLGFDSQARRDYIESARRRLLSVYEEIEAGNQWSTDATITHKLYYPEIDYELYN